MKRPIPSMNSENRKAPKEDGVITIMIRKFPCPTSEQFQRRAHEIFLARGGQPGHALEDWRQAEQELQAKMRPRPEEDPAA
jgi:hypothetical protein